ncbi:MAG: DNA polymerase/3'-5' exonuclease PolX [Methanomassiliicoccus sp.]|nr:DNA polymerase/3'-5' exonuclease PolX [Methanomassiliicoccus sp.]
MVNNAEIAAMLYQLAELMDLKGDVFKRNAYRRAAQSVEALDEDVSRYLAREELESIPGVGKAIAQKIREMVETGGLRKLDELRAEYPPGVVELMKVPDIGPRTAVTLYRELGIRDLDGLREAAERHRIRSLKGFGERTEENILKGLALVQGQGGRMLLGRALPIAESFARHLQAKGFEEVSVAGSLRRWRETIGDIDLLVGSDEPLRAMDAFTAYPSVAAVVSKGPTRSTVRLADGTQVDLRVVPRSSYGAALQYFTGSKEHNVVMRRLAIQRGLRLNEYGLFSREGEEMVAGRDEASIYGALDLEWVPPELREDRGEIEEAAAHRLPPLVREEDILGDFHVHTVMSDGRATMREVAMAAREKGYEYIGVTDHSRSLYIAHGVPIDDLLASVDEAHQLTEELGIEVLRGAEVDILDDGTYDYPEDVLAQLDYVIGSVHSGFKMTRERMTERILTALSCRELNILGHPSGRLIGKRDGYQVDMDQVIEEAARRGVMLEVNGSIERLDLNDLNCRKARELGAMVALNTDSHSLGQLDSMRYAVHTARRGWLGKEMVLNALPLEKVRAIFDGRST